MKIFRVPLESARLNDRISYITAFAFGREPSWAVSIRMLLGDYLFGEETARCEIEEIFTDQLVHWIAR